MIGTSQAPFVGRRAVWTALILAAVAMAPVANATGAVSESLRQTRTLIYHDFSDSAQGWQIFGDTRIVDPVYADHGGDPGGYIAGTDEAIGETWYFRAPASVLHALRAADGGTISFSLRQSVAGAGFPNDDIVIAGPAGRLSMRFPVGPGTDWTTFSVHLVARDGWMWNWSAPATQAQMQSVLADARRFDIRGEYQTGYDVGGLDNFTLTSHASQ